MTFEQYIEDHASSAMRAYLTGYADAIHNNAYFFGGCPKRFQYRPYNEYMQHIDIYIAQKTKESNASSEIFLQKSVEPFLTEVILKYIDCTNPEAIQIQDQPKDIQVEVRDVASDIMQKTKKYQTVDEREMEFQYNEYLQRLKNPPKVAKKAKHGVAKKKEVDPNISKPIAEKLREQSDKKMVEIKKDEAGTNGDESVIDGVKDIAKGLLAKFTPSSDAETKPETKPSDATIKIVKGGKQVAKPATEKTQNTTATTNAATDVQPKQVDGSSSPSVEQKSVEQKSGVDLSVPDLQITKGGGNGSGNGGAKQPANSGGKGEPQSTKQEYKLDAMDINLDTLDNAKLPSI